MLAAKTFIERALYRETSGEQQGKKIRNEAKANTRETAAQGHLYANIYKACPFSGGLHRRLNII